MARHGRPRVNGASPELRDLPASVVYCIEKGLERLSDEGEAKIPIGLEDGSGDRYGLLTDEDAIERRLRVTRIVVVVEPARFRTVAPETELERAAARG